MLRFARAAAVPVAVLALAACGSGDNGTEVSDQAAAGPAAGDTSYPGRTAEQIMQAARKSAESARTVTMHGKSGENIVFDMARANGKGMVGSVSVNGGALKLRQIGKLTYAQASPEFLSSLGSMGTSMSGIIGTKWLVADPASLAAIAQSTGDGIMSAFSTYDSAGSTVTASVPADATLSRVAGKNIEGVQTTGVAFKAPIPASVAAAISAAGGKPPATIEGTVYVPVSGPPLPLAIQSNAGVDLTLTDWNQPVKLVAPPKQETISLAQLGVPGL